MARGRVQLKRIENKKYRQVTFAKRRSGLIKKALEISVLCDAQVALIIFSAKGNLFEYSSDSRMEKILERYNNFSAGENQLASKKDNLEGHWAYEHAKFKAKIELLERNHRNYLGQDLDALSMAEIQNLEQQMDVALKRIRARKEVLMLEYISKLQEKEKEMLEQNYMLLNKVKEIEKSQAEEYSSSLTYTQLLSSSNIGFSIQRGIQNLELTLEPTQ